jgi:hypothetical protein
MERTLDSEWITYMLPIQPAGYDCGNELERGHTTWGAERLSTYKLRAYDKRS